MKKNGTGTKIIQMQYNTYTKSWTSYTQQVFTISLNKHNTQFLRVKVKVAQYSVLKGKGKSSTILSS